MSTSNRAVYDPLQRLGDRLCPRDPRPPVMTRDVLGPWQSVVDNKPSLSTLVGIPDVVETSWRSSKKHGVLSAAFDYQ